MKQTEKLYKLLRHAYDNVPYYQRVFEENKIEEVLNNKEIISEFPYLNKPIIRENSAEMFAKDVDMNNIIWEYTSGTSGTPLKIGKLQSERTKNALQLMKWRKKNFDVNISDKYAFFTTFSVKEKVRVVRNAYYLSEIHLDDETLLMYYNIMVENEVRWMYSTPAVTYVFMNFMNRFNLPRIESIIYIELSGERVLREEKDRFSKFFGCTVAEQYGTIELWSVAQECKHGKLHIMEDSVFFEINEDGAFITALDVYSMPIIRYHVDDDLEFDTPCTCGADTQTIRIIKSRSKEFLFVGEDVFLSPIMLNIAINKIMDNYDIGIMQFQYIQHEYDSLHCYIVYSNDDYSSEQIHDILFEQLKQLYPFPTFFKLGIVRMNSLIGKMKRGKLGYFKSEIPNRKEI